MGDLPEREGTGKMFRAFWVSANFGAISDHIMKNYSAYLLIGIGIYIVAGSVIQVRTAKKQGADMAEVWKLLALRMGTLAIVIVLAFLIGYLVMKYM